ncbi:APC family permease [Desulfovibrio sp. JC010]|uniref:APC family permease n=1 Tax=Desulfovibrio sp. JC010 TaxID=2593641 RepID=UPI0013D1268C|nr:APC family permease [Desulfovibrio sp. JC010]NDV25111.1 APC family permease [Desulfovibrio sp. JC010]
MSGIFTSLAVMLSPRGLEAVGHGAGLGGAVFMGLLVLAALVSVCTARSIDKLNSGELRATPVDRVAFGFLDAARFFTLTVLAVSWLGIAGYGLNEIFLSSFPNLAASFTILAVAVWACFLNDKYAGDLFGGSLTLAFLSFVYVAVMVNQPVAGGMGYPTSLPEFFTPLFPAGLLEAGPVGWMQLVFLAVLVFIGFDLPLVFENKSSRAYPAIFLILVAFALFSWAALLVETPEGLLGTTVPHLKVAGHVLEGKGRLLMGGTIILATFAAIFGLFQLFGQRVRGVVAENYSRYAAGGAAVFIGGVIAVMLAKGWAGKDELESLISAGLCFWFGSYALIDLLGIIAMRKAGRFYLPRLLTLALHAIAAAVCCLHIEFTNYFLYAVGCMAVAGIALGFSMKEYCNYPPLEEAEEAEAEPVFDPETGEIIEKEQSDPVQDDPEDEDLNIVSYK